MYPAIFTPSYRTRSTPFTRRVNESNVQGYTVYNHMLLPTFFESATADYHHLKRHVQLWDVSCERQVEISGPDAADLMQRITPRSLEKFKPEQCYYIPVVDEHGCILNDPVAVKHSEDRYWVSLADSDLLLWIKGYAIGQGLDVSVFEPDVSPLGVQGPKAETLMARVFGEAVRDIGFFKFARLRFEGQEFVVARSGYSGQGGFEIYVEGTENGEPLWDALFEAGEDLNVRAGCPNLIERIESGLLSYGNDMTQDNTLYECGLGKFSHPEKVNACIGREALLAQQAEPPKKLIRGFRIAGEPIPSCTQPWPIFTFDGKERAGCITSAAWSPDFNSNIAIGMLRYDLLDNARGVYVETPEGEREVLACTLPFK